MIIDTNVYSALDRGDAVVVEVLRGQSGILVPIFVVGELRYGFLNGSRTVENDSRLNRLLAQENVEVLYPTPKTASLYAELAVMCRRMGRALSHNDIWIAALAYEHEVPLFTFDEDFLVFEGMSDLRVVVPGV